MTIRFCSAIIALLLASLSPAAAIDQASSPPKFTIPWGNSAGSAYIRSIPTPSQIGIQNCAASLTDGFPPLTFVAASAGGCPPFGQDFNGILRQLSQAAQWGQAGGPVFYDSAFATGIGGYPKGTLLTTKGFTIGTRWISLVDNNMADPDADETNWAQDPSQIPYGTPVQSLSSTVPRGYFPANGLTVGTAASNATGLADGVVGNSQAYLLFVFIWRNFPNNAIFTSGGSPTSRGASALLDFAANKAIATPVMKGLGLMGADTMAGAASTFLAGVPVTSGSTTVPGSVVGENLHALVASENGSHSHSNSLTDPGHNHPNSLTDPGHSHANSLTDPGHAHANTLTDPGHAHGNVVTDPGHSHNNTLTDPGHNHLGVVTDPGHSHNNTISDPQHNHATLITQAQFNISAGGVGPFLFGASLGGGAPANTISNHLTGVTVNNASADTGVTVAVGTNGTGLIINNSSSFTGATVAIGTNGTGMSVNNATNSTGMSVNNASSFAGLTINNGTNGTGISINNASSGSGTGHNTAQRGMIVYWNLKL